MSERVALGMACLTLSLQLKNGELDEMTLAELHARAERLPVSDPLFLAVNEAMVQAEIADPAQLRAIGHRLHEKLELALRPDPPGMQRADIHG
jgi:hypothetical protein